MDLLDMVGKPCPIPVIEAKKAMAQAAPGAAVQLLVDNDIARQNLGKLAEDKGWPMAYEAREDGTILVTLTKATEGAAAGAQGGAAAAPAGVVPQAGATGAGFVVAIGQNTMGAGDDELGAALMKSYLYALTELDTPPELLLFFNSGVRLTTEGSAALDDLRALVKKGTQVRSCGACLNFYGLTDRLQVGEVTNMYAIAAAMAGAARLVNL